MTFDPTTARAIARIDRVLKHHDSTIRALQESSSGLEREAFDLLRNRSTRLQASLAAVQVNRVSLIDGLHRLGVDLKQPDAAIGRALRQALGVIRAKPAPAATVPVPVPVDAGADKRCETCGGRYLACECCTTAGL